MSKLMDALRWVAAHWETIAAAWAITTAMLASAWRRLPEADRVRLEQEYPRVANALRFARKSGVDIIPALQALWLLFAGKRWPGVPAKSDPPQPTKEAK